MSRHFVQSSVLRKVALGVYRAVARVQFWRSGPRVLVNSIPKAGTHLLTAELNQFKELRNSRLHLDSNRICSPEMLAHQGPPAPNIERTMRYVSQVRLGQFFTAHWYWSPELLELMNRCEIRSLFMIRDPRDMLASRLYYIKTLKRHPLHRFINNGFRNDNDRYRALIRGHDRPFGLPERTRLEAYLPWTVAPQVLTVKFEDLVGEHGGGSVRKKHETLVRIAEHCGLNAEPISDIAARQTHPTATLRRGKIGTWREELPADIIAEWMDNCADVVTAFGYPED